MTLCNTTTEADIFVNGARLGAKAEKVCVCDAACTYHTSVQVLRHHDRLRFGTSLYFAFIDPACVATVLPTSSGPHVCCRCQDTRLQGMDISWEAAHMEAESSLALAITSSTANITSRLPLSSRPRLPLLARNRGRIRSNRQDACSAWGSDVM